MFFLATSDEKGRPQCSYKGGAPGFVRVVDERTIPCAPLLTTAMECTSRRATSCITRTSASCSSTSPTRRGCGCRAGRRSADDPELVGTLPGRPVRRAGRRRRGVPELPAVHPPHGPRATLSAFVPAADGSAPVPDWKRAPWACDVLAAGRSRPWLTDSPAGRSSPSARRSSSAPARRTRRTHSRRRRPPPSTTDHDRRRRHRRRRPRRPRPRQRRPHRWPPTRSCSGVCAGDPDEQSAVLWTRPRRRHSTDEVDVDVGGRRRRGASPTSRRPARSTRPRRRRPQRARRRRARRPGVVPVPRRRVHQPGRAGRPDAGRPPRAAAGHGDRASTGQTGFYAAHRDIAEWAPDLVVFLGDFIYENAGRARRRRAGCRAHDGPEPTDLAGYRARYAQYLVRPAAAGVACGAARGRRSGTTTRSRTTTRKRDVAGSGARRGQFRARRAAAYRAWWEHMPVRLPAPPRLRRLHHLTAPCFCHGTLVDVLAARYPPVPVRSGLRRAGGSSLEPPCPEWSEPDPHDAGLGAGGVAVRPPASVPRRPVGNVLGQQVILGKDHALFNGAVLNFDQWTATPRSPATGCSTRC